ncbi:MAG: hypothetical protein ACXAC8_06815 [Candidatus Hodarchaeales archaeon]
MKSDVFLSVFDHKKGPVLIYSSLDSKEIAQKIAVRSFIAIGAMEESHDLSGKHAVVPFPSVNKIAFLYMFEIEKNDPAPNEKNTCWATIGYLSESSSSIDFYRSLPNIQGIIPNVVEPIQKSFKYSKQDNTLSNEIIESFSLLREPIPDKTKEELDTKITITMPDETSSELNYEDFKQGDLTFLFDYFSENLEKVIYALLLEEPVIIIGDIKDLIQKVVSSLELLVPHRIMKKKYLTTYIEPEKEDLLICSSHLKFLKKYKNYTTVNMVTRHITSKVSCPSIGDLLHALKIAPTVTQKTLIRNYIDSLLSKTAELMELCEKDQINHEEIKFFRGNLKADELNIVISIVRHYAPQFESKLFYFARSIV